MDALLRFGRLEIRQTEDLAADPDWAVLLHPEPAELVRWREASRQMEAALAALGSRGLKKDRTVCPPPRISQVSFWMRRHCGSSRRWQRRSWAIRPARSS